MSETGFAAMGKPIGSERRSAAYDWLTNELGLSNEAAWDCVGKTSNKLERDLPYEAQEAAMQYVDLTGAYRLFAYLLAG